MDDDKIQVTDWATDIEFEHTDELAERIQAAKQQILLRRYMESTGEAAQKGFVVSSKNFKSE